MTALRPISAVARKSPIAASKRGRSTRNESCPASDGKDVEFDLRAGGPQPGIDLALLVDGEQNVGFDTDHERPDVPQTSERRLERATVLREVELIHRLREREKAIRVEDLRETLGLVLEIGLDLESRLRRAPEPRRPRPPVAVQTACRIPARRDR